MQASTSQPLAPPGRRQLPVQRARGQRVKARATTTRKTGLAELAELRELRNLQLDTELRELELRDVRDISYVSRRRMDAADFNPDEVDEDGLPLVYNEEKISQASGSECPFFRFYHS